jgi:hypothetical protein
VEGLNFSSSSPSPVRSASEIWKAAGFSHLSQSNVDVISFSSDMSEADGLFSAVEEGRNRREGHLLRVVDG